MSDIKSNTLFNNILLTKQIIIKSDNIKNLNELLLQKIKLNEGLCIEEGYIKIDSCKIISYDNPIMLSDTLKFNVVFMCDIINPVESQIIDCVVKSITKVGIRAELNLKPSPLIIFVARDHNYQNENFSKINLEDNIKVKIIGTRYELNDKFISVIAEYIEEKDNLSEKLKVKSKTSSRKKS